MVISYITQFDLINTWNFIHAFPIHIFNLIHIIQDITISFVTIHHGDISINFARVILSFSLYRWNFTFYQLFEKECWLIKDRLLLLKKKKKDRLHMISRFYFSKPTFCNNLPIKRFVKDSLWTKNLAGWVAL